MMNQKFEQFFEKVYQSRWGSLRQALISREKQVLRQNLFLNPVVSKTSFELCSFLKNCYWRPENFSICKNESGFFSEYVMDPASVIVALSLEVQEDDQVLDLCAAPGGKSLILAETMFLKHQASHLDEAIQGSLICNEYSESRRERLLRVVQDYIPREHRLFLTVKGLDGNQYGLRYANSFDRILADVPCSGERHLFENSKELSLWTERRTQNLAVRQYSLLSSAWLGLRDGGRLVYSTCSISPYENDQVIQKLVKKRNPSIMRPIWLEEFSFLEKTQYGYQILPDRCGFGPMYFSVIEKPADDSTSGFKIKGST